MGGLRPRLLEQPPPWRRNMKLAINATSAKMGGAATYLDSVLPELDRQLQEEPGSHITVWGTPRSSPEGSWPAQVEFLDHPAAARGGMRRLVFDQVQLPRALKRERFDVLFSSANFGPLRCPCRQVLLVRNPIYFSGEYYARMTSRSVRLQLLVQRWLTLRAAARAQAVLFPTLAMMEMVAAYAGGPKPTWSVAPYGIRHDLFRPQENGKGDGPEVRLLHVSHYCDQKDVGTLLRSVALLHARAADRFHLTLTAGFDHLKESENRHCPTLTEDRKLFKELELQGLVTDLGSVPYTDLPGHYKTPTSLSFPLIPSPSATRWLRPWLPGCRLLPQT